MKNYTMTHNQSPARSSRTDCIYMFMWKMKTTKRTVGQFDFLSILGRKLFSTSVLFPKYHISEGGSGFFKYFFRKTFRCILFLWKQKVSYFFSVFISHIKYTIQSVRGLLNFQNVDLIASLFRGEVLLKNICFLPTTNFSTNQSAQITPDIQIGLVSIGLALCSVGKTNLWPP